MACADGLPYRRGQATSFTSKHEHLWLIKCQAILRLAAVHSAGCSSRLLQHQLLYGANRPASRHDKLWPTTTWWSILGSVHGLFAKWDKRLPAVSGGRLRRHGVRNVRGGFLRNNACQTMETGCCTILHHLKARAALVPPAGAAVVVSLPTPQTSRAAMPRLAAPCQHQHGHCLNVTPIHHEQTLSVPQPPLQ